MVMVDPVEQNQQAFNGWMQLRMRRAKEWDLEPKNSDILTEEDEESEPTHRNDMYNSQGSLQGFEDF